MRLADVFNTLNTRPVLIVRSRGGQGIVARVPAESLNDWDLRKQVATLRTGFPESQYEIDQSQVHYAREGILGA